MTNEWNQSDVLKRFFDSHLILRRFLGIMGIGLPVVLMIWGFIEFGHILPSISDYYSVIDASGHSYGTRDVFVGTLVAMGLFLGAYRGYDKRDDIAGYIAGICAIGVAFFPNKPAGWWNNVHVASAILLFVVLAFFSIILFTKTKPSKEEKWWNRILDVFRRPAVDDDGSRKELRNKIYVICGGIMLFSLVTYFLITVYGTLFVKLKTGIYAEDSTLLFWVESGMLWTFGISWFVKGEWLGFLKDKEITKGP